MAYLLKLIRKRMVCYYLRNAPTVHDLYMLDFINWRRRRMPLIREE